MIILTGATENKSRKQFRCGVRIDFSLQQSVSLREVWALPLRPFNGWIQTTYSKTDVTWHHLYLESKKNDTNEFIYRDRPQTESNLMVTKVEREEGEIRSLGLTDTHYYI